MSRFNDYKNEFDEDDDGEEIEITPADIKASDQQGAEEALMLIRHAGSISGARKVNEDQRRMFLRLAQKALAEGAERKEDAENAAKAEAAAETARADSEEKAERERIAAEAKEQRRRERFQREMREFDERWARIDEQTRRENAAWEADRPERERRENAAWEADRPERERRERALAAGAKSATAARSQAEVGAVRRIDAGKPRFKSVEAQISRRTATPASATQAYPVGSSVPAVRVAPLGKVPTVPRVPVVPPTVLRPPTQIPAAKLTYIPVVTRPPSIAATPKPAAVRAAIRPEQASKPSPAVGAGPSPVRPGEAVPPSPPSALVSPTTPALTGGDLLGWRTARGLTQRAAAELLAVAPSTVAKAELLPEKALGEALVAALRPQLRR